jgi:UDP-glucose 4-epimerase
MAVAEDRGNYFRVPPDIRDLNYNKYFFEGESGISRAVDYHSSNTRQLDVQETKEMLLTLDFIQKELERQK